MSKIIYEIDTLEKLDSIKKPLVSFYSPKKTIQSLIALPEVKNDLRKRVKQGKRIVIARVGDRFSYNISGERDNYWDGADSSEKGIEILDRGLASMRYTSGDYSWMIWPPIIFAAIGSGIGVAYGHWSQIWAEGTMGAIEKAEIVNGLIGTGIGGVSGLGFDAIVGGASVVKDKLEEPFKRIHLAQKVKYDIDKLYSRREDLVQK